MKIKKIAAVCKACGVARLQDQTDSDGVVRQWIETDYSIYPVERLPYLTEAQMCTVLDLSDKKVAEMLIEHKDAPDDVDFRDTAEGEVQSVQMSLEVSYGRGTFIPLMVRNKTWFVGRDLMEPILAEYEEVELFLRRTSTGTPYFAVKAGLICVGLIWPIAHMDKLAELLCKVGAGYQERAE